MTPIRLAPRGPGSAWAALPGRPALPGPHRARDRAGGARGARPHAPALADRCSCRRRPADAGKRAEADELIDFLGLGRYADTFVSDLSTGTRRIVELACLLALDARVLLPRRADRRGGAAGDRGLRAAASRIREELGATLLIIEHDMPLIMSISDRVYCLEAGNVIAEGTPDEVRHDPSRDRGYLGTDERAIDRSGAVAAESIGEPVV